jgi:hypothetical protein
MNHNRSTITPHSRKDSTMKRTLFASLLAVSLATTALGVIAQPAHAGGPAPLSRQAALYKANYDFGWWMTYGARTPTTPPSQLYSANIVNARINSFVDAGFRTRLPSGLIINAMHLMNTPNGWRFAILQSDGLHATSRIRWLFGSSAHTPVVRLDWTYTAAGWKITGAAYLGQS